jgi:hypothetical protein
MLPGRSAHVNPFAILKCFTGYTHQGDKRLIDHLPLHTFGPTARLTDDEAGSGMDDRSYNITL